MNGTDDITGSMSMNLGNPGDCEGQEAVMLQSHELQDGVI